MASSKHTVADRHWIDRSMAGVVLATLTGFGAVASGLIYLLINADRDDDLSRLKSQLISWCILGALPAFAMGIVWLRKALYRTLAVTVSLCFLLFVATCSFLVEQKNGGDGLSSLPIAGWQVVIFLLIAGSVAWCLRRASDVKPAHKFGASGVVSAGLMLFGAWIWAFGLGASKPQPQTQSQETAPAKQEPTSENILHVIATSLNVPEEKVVPTARFDEDLHVGEPDMEEMNEKLESTFGMKEPEEDEVFVTVQDVVDYIKSPDTYRSTHAPSVAELYPEGLLFSKTDQWVKVEGDEASIGVTLHAVQSVAFVGSASRLPQVGATVSAGSSYYAMVEEGMTGALLLAPVSGVVTAVNDEVTHSSIDKDPYARWIIKVKLTHPEELKDLLSPAEYRAFVEAGH